MSEKHCIVCGSPFHRAGKAALTAKYCSKKCREIQTIPLAERFWGKVDKAGPDECWLWDGARKTSGYGLIVSGGPRKTSKSLRAHRVSYELHHGSIPAGMVVRHSCDKPACVNPRHLIVGSLKDNTQDAIERGRHHIPMSTTKSRLSEEQLIALRAAEGTIANIAAAFGMSYTQTWRLRHGYNNGRRTP